MKEDGYKVGYKKPPRDHQFKSGQSGNPRGRPRGTPSFKSDLVAELQQQIVMVEDGRRRKISKQRALIQNLISSALKNDKTAVNALLAYLRYFGGENEEPASATPDVEDVDMIKGYLARIEAQIDPAINLKEPVPKKPHS
jgi:hypothetical protein